MVSKFSLNLLTAWSTVCLKITLFVCSYGNLGIPLYKTVNGAFWWESFSYFLLMIM